MKKEYTLRCAEARMSALVLLMLATTVIAGDPQSSSSSRLKLAREIAIAGDVERGPAPLPEQKGKRYLPPAPQWIGTRFQPIRVAQANSNTLRADRSVSTAASDAQDEIDTKPESSSADRSQVGDTGASSTEISAQKSETEGAFAGIALNGSVRTGYWSSNRLLDDVRNVGSAALWLEGSARPRDNISLYAEAWARSDNVFKGSDKHYLIREAYADISLGPMDFRVGRQIITWGRADRINPTDNLTPRNFILLVPEVDDDRFGLLSVKGSYHRRELSLTGIWLPDFRPDTPGVGFREDVPGSHRSWAVKLDSSGKALDWSVSYFDGFDLSPDISVAGASPTGIEVLLRHNRIRVLGADAATTVGRFGLRGEAAYTWTEDSGGSDPFVKNPFFFMVLGVERTFMENLNVNVQYFTRIVRHWNDPENLALAPPFQAVAIQQSIINNQLDRTQHGMTVRVSKKWFNDTLEAELATIWDFTREGYFLRPRVVYAFTDKWKGTVGADFYRGPDDSFFGRLEDNNTVFAEMSYWF